MLNTENQPGKWAPYLASKPETNTSEPEQSASGQSLDLLFVERLDSGDGTERPPMLVLIRAGRG